MPSHFYAPTKEDKFAFGIWCLQNRGRDPFGDQTRPELPTLECIRGLAQRNCYGFEFHDNDIVPFDAAPAQRKQILGDVKKAIGDWGIKATMATTIASKERSSTWPSLPEAIPAIAPGWITADWIAVPYMAA